MRAVAFRCHLPDEDPGSLQDIELPDPVPGPRDLRVRVAAVSVGRTDIKMHARGGDPNGGWQVLGWDAAGVVEAAGPSVTLFRPGDPVFYAGALSRPGTNAELHLVDERLVALKPMSLGFAEAAALPVAGLAAWEALFERLDIRRPAKGLPHVLLVVGGAGGVGSMAIQLARAMTDFEVVATASQPEAQAWIRSLGAHHVLDHRAPMPHALKALGVEAAGFVLSTSHTAQHMAELAELLAPFGRIALIDDVAGLEVGLLKPKSISLHWECMFTRSTLRTEDMATQGCILAEISRLVDAGLVKSTLTGRDGPISASALRRAHARVAGGQARGRMVVEGWP